MMSEEEMRITIKEQLKQLSKEQLIDVLTDIRMAEPMFRIANALSSLQCTNIIDAIDGIQRVDESFDPFQQILRKGEQPWK